MVGIRTYAIPTRFGFVGLVVSDSVLLKTTLGHTDCRDVADSLAAANPEWRLPIDSGPSEWQSRIQAYTEGHPDEFLDITIDTSWMTPFQQSVIQATRQIKYGATRSYGQLAKAAGYPNSARTVGTVMAKNRFPLIVPCHRVVGGNQRLGGFSAGDGVNLKRRLLHLEGALLFGV